MVGRIAHAGRGLILVAALLAALAVPGNAGAAVAGWAGPLAIGGSADCQTVAATVDAAGRFHVVAQCGNVILYQQRSTAGTWTRTTIAAPSGHADLVPQLAADGSRLYLAYMETAEGGCGGSATVGAFYRTRLLPGGAWSAPIRLGLTTDTLQSFRVVGGTIWAVVRDTRGDGRIDLVRRRNGSELRWHVPYAVGWPVGPASLRVGGDGRPRIAYEAANGLRYAVFSGTTFSSGLIPGTMNLDHSPVLVLDGGNAAHLTWVHSVNGCATFDTAADGTYYATNRGGAWTATSRRRITTDIAGATSLAVDVVTHRVHVAIVGGFGIRYYTRTATGPWSHVTLSRMPSDSVAIRLDQQRGRLVIAATAWPSISAPSSRLYAFVKG